METDTEEGVGIDFSYVREETVNSAALACRTGDSAALKRIVDANELAVSSRDNRGWQPLHEAAYQGHASCVKYLSKVSVCDMNARTWEGETPLFLACKNLPTTRKAVHALLKVRGVRVNLGTNEECTPLQYAAVKGDVEAVTWLVRRGAKVRATNVWKETALHCVFKTSHIDPANQLAVVEYLIKRGADVAAADENKLTPLMLAVQKGRVEASKRLLAKDPACLDMTAEDGASALMLACQSGQLECVKLLVEQGADVNIAAEDGTMAVHLACSAKTNSADILRVLLPLANVDLLYSAATPMFNFGGGTTCPFMLGGRLRPGPPLSPFHLAIDWENWDSLAVLATRLDSTRFRLPVAECLAHGNLCLSFREAMLEVTDEKNERTKERLSEAVKEDTSRSGEINEELDDEGGKEGEKITIEEKRVELDDAKESKDIDASTKLDDDKEKAITEVKEEGDRNEWMSSEEMKDNKESEGGNDDHNECNDHHEENDDNMENVEHEEENSEYEENVDGAHDGNESFSDGGAEDAENNMEDSNHDDARLMDRVVERSTAILRMVNTAHRDFKMDRLQRLGKHICPLVVFGKKNPLAHLVSGSQLVPGERMAEVVGVLHQDVQDPDSISPLLQLLLRPENERREGFGENSWHRMMLRQLLDRGARLNKNHMLLIILASPLKGLCALIQEGAIPPFWLVDEESLLPLLRLRQLEDMVVVERVEARTCYAHLLLSTAMLASQCCVMTQRFSRHVYDMVWGNLMGANIRKLDALLELRDAMTRPASLRQLARTAVHAGLQQLSQHLRWLPGGVSFPWLPQQPRLLPRDAVAQLPLPQQLKAYLLYPDLEPAALIRVYDDTWRVIRAALSNL